MWLYASVEWDFLYLPYNHLFCGVNMCQTRQGWNSQTLCVQCHELKHLLERENISFNVYIGKSWDAHILGWTEFQMASSGEMTTLNEIKLWTNQHLTVKVFNRKMTRAYVSNRIERVLPKKKLFYSISNIFDLKFVTVSTCENTWQLTLNNN